MGGAFTAGPTSTTGFGLISMLSEPLAIVNYKLKV